jgi:hypothetical protein
MVVNSGSSASGESVNAVDTTDISYGGWEGEATMGRSQEYRFRALRETSKKAPFEPRGLDSDRTGIPQSEGWGSEVSQRSPPVSFQ